MEPESDVRMPLTAHLEELRWRLVRVLLAVGVGFAVCYWMSEQLFVLLLHPLTVVQKSDTLIIGTAVTEAFFTKLKVAFVAALFLSSPVIFYQTWRFVAPGLFESEKRVAVPFAIVASFFFIAGAYFCYAVVFPVGLSFFLEQYASVAAAAHLRLAEYLSFASRMLLAFGITFELPVVTFFLARLGLVTHRTLIGWLRYAIVAIFIVAAVLTPGPDIASQLLMAAPLFVLYLVSILVAYLVARPARATVAAPDAGAP